MDNTFTRFAEGLGPLHEIFGKENPNLYPYRIRPIEGAEHETSPSGVYVVDIDAENTGFRPDIIAGMHTLSLETLEKEIAAAEKKVATI